MADAGVTRRRPKALSDVELRALVETYESKIETLLSSPSRKFAAWARSLAVPISCGRLRPLQSADDYFRKVEATVLRRSPLPVLAETSSADLPADIPAFFAKAPLPAMIALIDRLLAAQDYARLFALLDAPRNAIGRAEAEIARDYALVLLHVQRPAYSDAASIGARLLARGDFGLALGPEARLTVVGAYAQALAGLGRTGDALAAIGDALQRRPGNERLLRQRAEILAPDDPRSALADLDEAERRGGLSVGGRVLRLHLCSQAPAFDAVAARCSEEEHFLRARRPVPVDIHAALANAALRAGDVVGQRESVDRIFASQCLAPPIASPWTPVAFHALGNGGLPKSMDGPLVSVVMPAFNAAATIERSIRSVLDQTHANLELLVVDDASEDNTAELVEAMGAQDDRIRLLSNARNCGAYVARNRGLAEARGKFFTFQDSDDWAHPERLARHVELMTVRTDLQAARSMLVRMEEGGEIVLKRWGARFVQPNPASAFCRIGVRDEIGFFDSVRVGADTEHWFRIRLRFGHRSAAILPLVLSIALHHPRSLTRHGVGKVDSHGYSIIRERYQRSWLAWHRTKAVSRDLDLPPLQADRRFPAPPEIIVMESPVSAGCGRRPRTTPAARSRVEVAFRHRLAAVDDGCSG